MTVLATEPFTLDLVEPLVTATGPMRRREGIAIRLGSTEPIGVGEATPLAGWTESFVTCRRTIASVDRPNDAIEAGRLDGTPAARHAISLAIADRRARREGRSLARIFGGTASTDRLSVHRSIGLASPADTAERAALAVDTGYETIKVKVGSDTIEQDVSRVAAIRSAIGSAVAIRLDANGAWTRAEAEAALSALAVYDIDFVEQPLAPADPDGLGSLESPIPVAVDEGLIGRSMEDVAACFETVDVAILKPMVLGGVDRCLAVADLADWTDTTTVVTTTVDAVIARTAAVHLAAAIDPDGTHGLATGDYLASDIGPDPAPVRDGMIHVPTGPGLGTDGPWEVEDG